jgi:hypothetical protein
MRFEFKMSWGTVNEWWHADPHVSRVTYRHCRNDVHAPNAEPENADVR